MYDSSASALTSADINLTAAAPPRLAMKCLRSIWIIFPVFLSLLQHSLIEKLAALYHFKNLSSVLDVGKRIAVEDNQICELPLLQGSKFGLTAHDGRGILRGGHDDVHGTHACICHQFKFTMESRTVQGADIPGIGRTYDADARGFQNHEIVIRDRALRWRRNVRQAARYVFYCNFCEIVPCGYDLGVT